MYYAGEYKKSAIAAQCGLLKDENNFDILYNLGCIYEKLGDLPCATSMYQRALENCVNDGAAETIIQSLKLIGELSGK
jgi:tetratricopeptide (TPR) repeat protein